MAKNVEAAVATIDVEHSDGLEAEGGVTQLRVPIEAVHDWPADPG